MRSLSRFLIPVMIVSSTFTIALADDVVGAIWRVEFKDDGDVIRLQCTKNHKVFGPAGKEIGTWEGNAGQATITITKGAGRNGVYVITQLDKKPPTFRGKYTNAKGDNINIKVTLLKD